MIPAMKDSALLAKCSTTRLFCSIPYSK